MNRNSLCELDIQNVFLDNAIEILLQRLSAVSIDHNRFRFYFVHEQGIYRLVTSSVGPICRHSCPKHCTSANNCPSFSWQP